MDIPFVYSKYVTGKGNIGRKTEARAIANLLGQGENIVIYEAPKTGKTSLVQQAFFNMKSSGADFVSAGVSLLNVRTLRDLATRLGSEVLHAAYGSPQDYSPIVEALLPGTHFVFDPQRYADCGEILSLNWELDQDDLKAALSLPYRAARKCGRKIHVLLDEFQNIMLTEDGDRACRLMEEVFRELDAEDKAAASYIFTGSKVNAMHEIFGTKKYFFRQAERVKIGEIDTREIIDHVIRGLLASGKVIDRDLLLGVCKLFRNNICYINHFSAICDSLTKGYIMEPILNEALSTIVSIHEPRFIATMEDLTTFQVSLLRAVLDGQTKFTSSDVIEQYALNSSANVRRLKDALCKKEIITFSDNGVPSVIDPLFEYWARRYYFEMKI